LNFTDSVDFITHLTLTPEFNFFLSLGRESIAGFWCMQCTANNPQFFGEYPPWLMEDLCH
jgi:hypothetical protein